jgi:formate-dependent nitrite reductase membrane component NrfD
MLVDRANETGWTWLIYLEMFVAGVAAGAYVASTILALAGRGHSPTARTARLIAFPLMALAGLLLVFDLDQPLRFWHMVVQSERFLPMLKPWSPMSSGSWLLLLFSAVAFVSFVDTVVSYGWLRLPGWRHDRTLHGGGLGLGWSLLGSILAIGLGIYSAVLLTTSSYPGWSHLSMIPAVYIATALMTGVAAVLLVRAVVGQLDADTLSLDRTGLWLIGWWLIMSVIFLATLIGRPDAKLYLNVTAVLAFTLAIFLGGIVPLGLHAVRLVGPSGRLALSSVLVLIGGFLLRFGIVMGPQVR